MRSKETIHIKQKTPYVYEFSLLVPNENDLSDFRTIIISYHSNHEMNYAECEFLEAQVYEHTKTYFQSVLTTMSNYLSYVRSDMVLISKRESRAKQNAEYYKKLKSDPIRWAAFKDNRESYKVKKKNRG